MGAFRGSHTEQRESTEINHEGTKRNSIAAYDEQSRNQPLNARNVRVRVQFPREFP